MNKASLYDYVNSVYLLCDQHHDGELWKSVFAKLPKVSIIDQYPTTSIAMLASIMACERYGCPTGFDPNSWGRMYIYDDWHYDPDRTGTYPRFYISNAIWPEEPPLLEAAQRRMKILTDTLIAFNQTNPEPITSICIPLGILGFQNNLDYQTQGLFAAIVRSSLQNLEDG